MIQSDKLTQVEKDILESALDVQCDILCDMGCDPDCEMLTLVQFEAAKKMYKDLTGKEWSR